jgi:Leucine-rich repeat (LRR) protein
MKRLHACWVIILLSFSMLGITPGNAQNSTPDSTEYMLQEIQRLTLETNWNNEAAAKAAVARIEALNKQLNSNTLEDDLESEEPDSQEADQSLNPTLNKDIMYGKAWEAAIKAGTDALDADFDMAEPLREQIKSEYEEEEKDQFSLEPKDEPKTLIIDFAQQEGLLLYKNLANYRLVETLIFLNGSYASGFDADQAVNRSAHLPLKSIGVLGFGSRVSAIPEGIGHLNQLREIIWIGNEVVSIPTLAHKCEMLENLYLDSNPIVQISMSLSGLKHLKKLGLGKTKLTQEELNRLKIMFPSCQILTN